MTRCAHDMLTGQCSICKSLPYNPPSPLLLAEFEPQLSTDEVAPKLTWLPLEERLDCEGCNRRLDRGQLAAYSPDHEATFGICCREQVAA